MIDEYLLLLTFPNPMAYFPFPKLTAEKAAKNDLILLNFASLYVESACGRRCCVQIHSNFVDVVTCQGKFYLGVWLNDDATVITVSVDTRRLRL